jgi:iron complex transport system substrate-binding protein
MAADSTRLTVCGLAFALSACWIALHAVVAAQPAPRRIVSLIPATTEMIFAVGAGDRLVGASSYDRFPPEASRVPRVGGLLNPDTERILALRPDLVVVYGTQVELIQRLDRARIPYFPYEHRALPDIMGTIRSLGARIGEAPAAEALAARMERALADIRAAVAGRPRPRTLLVFSRDPGSLRAVYASGGYGFLADLLDVAGGDNVLADVNAQSVQVGTEMLLTLRPDVIVELRYGEAASGLDPAREIEPWKAVSAVPAVRNSRIHVLVGDEFVVPGPRIITAADRLAAALHLRP